MTDINTSNAIAQERARIREEVVKLPTIQRWEEIPYINRAEVLKIISNNQTSL